MCYVMYTCGKLKKMMNLKSLVHFMHVINSKRHKIFFEEVGFGMCVKKYLLFLGFRRSVYPSNRILMDCGRSRRYCYNITYFTYLV